MKPNIPQAVRHLVGEYRRFLRTSYRFLDDHLRRQFEEHLAKADVVVRGPFVTLGREFERTATLEELAAAGKIERDVLRANWPFGTERLYRHQERGLEVGRDGRCFVVTTGTGSGKTETFLLPVLDGILRRKREGITGVQAIFLYPMNALANDQLERLRRILRGSGLDLSFALYTGDSETATRNLREDPAETELLRRDAIRQRPPDILLTNYKQLEFLLVRKEDRHLFGPSLRYLVLDEVHSYRGALATEMACLIRRLKAHAELASGELLGIATSATVAAREDGVGSLARFVTTLFGEEFTPAQVIGEALAPLPPQDEPWTPAPPGLTDEDLVNLDPGDDEAVATLARKLTGRECPKAGPVAERIAAVLEGNAFVRHLEEFFANPATVTGAVASIQEHVAGRSELSEQDVEREIEAYLLVGSIGDDNHPPRLRPKLHTFFHGVYDVALCLNPECRALVPQGGTQCVRCGSAARPAALCRTCGQDFVKIRFEREGDDRPVGTGDFYSDPNTGFLAHRIHELPDDLKDEGGEEEEDDESKTTKTRRGRKPQTKAKLEDVGVCPGCGRLMEEGAPCPDCGQVALHMLLWRGKLSKCPACGDVYTRGDIVTPLRTGTASTVSVLTTHHLDTLKGEDRKLLVFADNRQDVAHQSGYTSDKHRSFVLRHAIAHGVQSAGSDGIALDELPQILLDEYRKLRIAPRRLAKFERERWTNAITYEVASEFTRYSRQRASLENLGLVAVEYEFLDGLESDSAFQAAVAQAGLDPSVAMTLVRVLLDAMRRYRAVAYPFFQEYIDPNKKRRYRELESDPYNVRFPDRDQGPKAFSLDRPDHIRKARRLLGFFQENKRAGQLTAMQKVVARLVGDRQGSEDFLRALVPILKEHEILVPVPSFPIPRKERTGRLEPLQIDPRVIRLSWPETGYRCNACNSWRPYAFPTCPTPKCGEGKLQPQGRDEDNYYVRLYLDREPQRLLVSEHSAQINGDERAKRETALKEGKLDILVCTPTLELGVDIGPLLTVVLRNAPPTPTNYAQRVGRAGRRLRIGFVSTFCAGGSHDRHAFEEPEWLVAGRFEPPRLRLDNPKIVWRHLRSFLLERVESQLPARMGELLDDIRTPSRWEGEKLADLFGEVAAKREALVDALASVLAADRDAGRTDRYDREEVEKIVDGFEEDLREVFEVWWRRVEQLDREFREYAQVGSPREDQKKANARRRAYYEVTQDPERAYTLNFLSTRGLLPAYQFPVDTFSLDPGVDDTPTLYRPSAIALQEFAPGNYVYANGHKLRSIRVLFPGGPGSAGGPGRSDAETSGRLQAFHFCESCEEAIEAPQNNCPRCGADLPRAVDSVFVDAFEAEESLRIGSDEESRQRQYHVRRENLLVRQEHKTALYEYPLAPVEHIRLAEVLVTNWGPSDSKTGEGGRFWLCPDCGRHLPHDPNDPDRQKQVNQWSERHSRYCSGRPSQLILAYKFETDCLVLTVPERGDETQIGRSKFSPTLVTLAEALLAGAGSLLELEPGEITAFVRKAPGGKRGDQIVFYETVPGGAGYVEELAARMPEVAEKARERLYGHRCSKGCYLCLKSYGNQRWHPFFDKDRIRDLLVVLANQDVVESREVKPGDGADALEKMLDDRQAEATRDGEKDPATGKYRKGFIEEPLREALEKIHGLPPGDREHEIKDGDTLITVPDFAWPGVKLAVYCDGFAYHGDAETLALDARKRNTLQGRMGWTVLTYWGRTILKNATACAEEIADVYREKVGV